MKTEDIKAALDEMTDDAVIPKPPPPPPDNTWVPGKAAIKVIIGLFVDGIEAGWNQAPIFHEVIRRARDDYQKTVTRRQLRQIWDAWQAEIRERQAPEPKPEP